MARKVTEELTQKMKIIDELVAMTEQKFRTPLVPRGEHEDFESFKVNRDRLIKKGKKINQSDLKESRLEQLEQDVVKARVAQRQRASNQHTAAPKSNIDSKLFKDKNADKEILNLVDSQFGQGFLELNFEDDDQNPVQQQKPTVQSVKKPKYEEPEFNFNETKSAKPVKNSSRLLTNGRSTVWLR